MMRHDGAALRVLYLGGTGTISTSCVRLSVESGMSVFVLNRGNNSAAAGPAGRRHLADRGRDATTPRCSRPSGASGSTRWSTSCPTTPTTCAGWWRCSARRTKQYVHISSGSIYAKPVQQSPISESTPIAPNPVLAVRPGQVAGRARAAAGQDRSGLPGHHRPAVAHLRRREPAPPGGVDGRGPDRQGRRDPGARGRDVAVDADSRRGLRAGAGRPAGQPASDRGGLQHHGRGRLHLGPDLHDHRGRARRRGEPRPRRVRAVSGGRPGLVLVGRDARRHRPHAPSSTPPRSARSCPASRPSSPSTGPPGGWSSGGPTTRTRPARTTRPMRSWTGSSTPTMRRGQRSPNARRSPPESARERAPPCASCELGGTGLAVTPLCFGTSPLASMANLYGYAVDEERAIATVEAAFDSPVNFIDTSNGYGEDGTAERRIGAAIRRAGGLPPRAGARHQGRPRSAHRRLLRRSGPRLARGVDGAARCRPDRAAASARPGADPVRGGHRSRRAGGRPGRPPGARARRSSRRRRRAGRAASAIPRHRRVRGAC